MEQQIAINPFHVAELASMTHRAANAREELLPGSNLGGVLGRLRNAPTRRWQGGYKTNELVALLGGHVEPRGLIAFLPRRSSPWESWHFQAKLIGTSLQCELAQCGHLTLPTETPDPAILEA